MISHMGCKYATSVGYDRGSLVTRLSASAVGVLIKWVRST